MRRLTCNVLCFVLAIGVLAQADETDQFLLPDRELFTDLGPYFDVLHYRVLERIVEEANEHIERALMIPNEPRRRAALDRLHSPDRLADRARHFFGQGWVVARALESALYSDLAQEAYPDKLIIYTNDDWIYRNSHLPFDPRRIMYNFCGPTIKVHGVFFGIDKVGHGYDLGHMYFTSYRRGIARGLNEEDAMARTIRLFSTGPISERGLIGAVGTGVQSNADLASNYLGMKFYMNMTEPVMLKGEQHPPLLVRIGEFWAINQHVRPESGFMAPFYSDHLNEALNPCIYGASFRDNICQRLRENREQILAFYADEDREPRPREYFEKIATELSTYYGEDYGHGGIDPVATIVNCCFDDETRIDQHAQSRDKWIDPAATP